MPKSDVQVHTEFTGDPSGAVNAGQAAEKAIRDANKQNKEGAESAAQVGEGFKKAEKGAKDFLGTIGFVKGAFAQLAGVLGATFSIVKIVDYFNTLDERLAKSRIEFRLLAEESARAELFKIRGQAANEFDAKIQEIRAATQKQVEDLTNKAQEKLTSLTNVAARQIGLAPSRAEIDEDLKRATQTLNETAAARIAAVEKERDAKIKADEDSARAAETRRLAEQQQRKIDQQIATDERVRLEDDAILKQRAALAETARQFGQQMGDALLEPLRKLEDARKSFFDSQEFATSIDNLVGALNATTNNSGADGWGYNG